jgi:hypothetical protein
MKSWRAAVLVVVVAACGDSASHPLDSATHDAQTDAASVAPTCGGKPLVFSRTEAEVTTALEGLLADVRASEPEAYFREATDGTRVGVWLSSLHVALGVAPNADPRPAAMTWLGTVSPGVFTAGEWTAEPLAAPFDPASAPQGLSIVAMARASIDGVPWPMTYPDRWVEGGALTLFVSKDASGWTLTDVQLVPTTALATRADAELLAGCMPDTKPEATLRTHSYGGAVFDGQCNPASSYTYVPHDGDATTWLPGLGFAVSEVVDGRARWRAFSSVELEIAPANYFPSIELSDCYCEGVAGFTLRVDAVTGEVLRVQPAIRCAVC